MKHHCRPDVTSVTMGSVDEASVTGSLPKPNEHIFLTEKASWWDLDSKDSLERYETFDPPFEKLLHAWQESGRPSRKDI